jgi:catechol 2,3-dioxygenase-like lactoylglutathione lyase family enzyme
MAFSIDHLHIKADNVDAIVAFYTEAFDFAVVADEVRQLGDRFVRLQPPGNDLTLVVSSRRDGEVLEAGSGRARYGLDHFGVQSRDVAEDIARLEALGAVLAEGPLELPGGLRAAFLVVPGGVRVELVEQP